jgi:hypothetical protein
MMCELYSVVFMQNFIKPAFFFVFGTLFPGGGLEIYEKISLTLG